MQETSTILIRLALALAAGSLIGLERSYHGRPAGFRTHALVCTASALLMLLPQFVETGLAEGASESIRLDPTRMAQGIMTGIGFLGAGVIVKEGLTIRGLTTAASIWMTASIGIMVGAGLYLAAGAATLVAFGVLAVFRLAEPRLPAFKYARVSVRFAPNTAMSEAEIRRLIGELDMSPSTISQQFDQQGVQFETTVRARRESQFQMLAEALRGRSDVIQFTIDPTGE